MPNWCENVVTFTGPREKLDELIAGAEKGALLQTIRPMPETVFRGNVGSAERAEHGANNWYDWSVSNWGTKWDVECESIADDGESVRFYFMSAWSPPVEAYVYASEQGLGVSAMYCEPGCNFVGRYDADGENTMTIDECNDSELQDYFAWAFEEEEEDA
jgi:hypothetical protein